MLRVICILIFLVLSSFAQTYLDSTAAIEDRVDDLLSRMTLDEKIGQMTQADRSNLNSMDEVKTYLLGSVLSGGGSAPNDNSAEGWADMYDAFQTKALGTRLKIPVIYGIDAVHGHNNVKGAVIFPHNIGMGCTWNPELIEKAAEITAIEVAGTGIDWTFAPCIAVPRDERWGRTYEGFGETSEITGLMSSAAVYGFQGDSLADRGSITACAKHFIADGGTSGGKDQGNAQMDETMLRAVHLPGYQAAINAGVKTIMASYSSWNGQKVHGSKYLLTDLLKTELGFEGFAVSDWNAVNQLDDDYSIAVKQAIDAGIDMVMAPDTYAHFISTLKQLVNDSEISMERIDDAVARILHVKFEMGLFERPFTQRSLTDSIGSSAHREVARQAVRESMVLLKKENGILPLDKEAGKILVAGDKADNLGYQCGGWTISWQGSGGEITDGTTILEGIQKAVNGATIEYSADGSDISDDPDVAVVVIGETPYAEGSGDDDDLHIRTEDVETVRRIKEAGVATIVILISGRPMILDNVIHFADVLFAAWLPGSEGDGIADILFGDYQPGGKLTHSWPRSMNQIPMNWGDEYYNPLFPYKHGILSLKNYGPESAPIVHSALLQKNGKTIELDFSKAMADPRDTDGFAVEVNALPVSLTAVKRHESDENILLLDLETSANAGDSLSISYTPGTVSAADGSFLQSFSGLDIYNMRNEGSAEQSIPGRVEAENYSSMSGVQLEQTTDEGGGSNVGFIDQTDWMEYDLLVPDSGKYHVDLRVAAESQSARIGFIIDGNVLVILDLPVTGGWQTWETTSTELSLKQGLQKLKIFAFIGGYNLNWMDFSLAVSEIQEDKKAAKFRLFQNYPNPFNSTTTINYDLNAKCSVNLSIYDIAGRKIKTLVNQPESAGRHQVEYETEYLGSGIYIYILTTSYGYKESRKMILIK